MISDKQIWMRSIFRLVVMLAMANAAAGQAAIAVLSSDKGVKGTITFAQNFDGTTTVEGSLAGLSPGLHGIHIHDFGDISENCKHTGTHFNPFHLNHGGPQDFDRHAGDLGNINVSDDGTASFTIVDNQIPLWGAFSILGRSIVIHQDADDLGKGGNELSKINGNSGEKIACGVIGIKGT